MQCYTSSQSPAYMFSPSRQQSVNVTPNKEMFVSFERNFVIANTTPPHAIASNNTPVFSLQPANQGTKRCIAFTDSPSPKKIAISRNYSPQYQTLPNSPSPNKIAISRSYSPLHHQPLPVRRNILLPAPPTRTTCCDATTQTDTTTDTSVSNNVKKQRVVRRVDKTVNRRRRLNNPGKHLDDVAVKQLKDRRNTCEKDRVRRLSGAFNVLKSRLPPTKMDEETSQPIFPKTHFEIIQGAIAYMKTLKEILDN